MNKITLALLLLVGGVAHADGKPEVVDETDLLRVQLLETQAELASRVAKEAREAFLKEREAFQKKYKLETGDKIDQNRAIQRAPKKAAAK